MFPILLTLGPVKIYSFGVFLLLALIVASFVIWREGRNQNFDDEKLIDLLIFEAIFGLIGARIYYFVTHFADFGFPPFNLFLFVEKFVLFFHFPGLSFMGALLGGVVGAIIFSRKKNWPFWQVGNFLALGVVLGEAIGSLGAFLSGSAYGTATSLPWGVPMIGLLGRRHPVQIYEFLGTLLIFVILLKFKNQRFLLYFLLFGLLRFFLEFLRGDSVYFYDLKMTQIVCFIFIVVSGALLYKRLGRSPRLDILLVKEKLKNIKMKGNNNNV